MKKILLAIAVVGLVGCGKSEEKKADTTPTPAPATTQTAPIPNNVTATATAPANSNTATATGQNFTVDYLKANESVRNQILEDCKANKQTDQNCKNANEAKALAFNQTGGKKVQKW